MGALGFGGLAARRPDQYRRPWAGTMLPAPQSGQFIGRLVVIFGTGPDTGLYVYQGTPALGNPPVFYVTTASHDPYGNIVNPASVDQVGFTRWVYGAAAGAGSLISAESGSGGLTDAYGNKTPPAAGSAFMTNFGGFSGALVITGSLLQFYTAVTEAGPWTQQATFFWDNTNTRMALSGADLGVVSGNVDIATAGKGLKVAEGSNARLGTATLVAGTVTIANTSVVASTRVLFQRSVAGGTLGHLSRTITVGTSFTINSTSATDTSQIAWMLVDPG